MAHDATKRIGTSAYAAVRESQLSSHYQDNHSDAQDSSTDETVIPYMLGERQSQEYISTASFERFDPEASPKSHLSRVTRRSIDTDQCGTLYEETVLEPSQSGTDYNVAEMQPHETTEDQRLVTSPNGETKVETPKRLRSHTGMFHHNATISM